MTRHLEPPAKLSAALLRKWPLPAVHPKLGKEGRGDVLVIGGSRRVPGAAILAAVGALRAGAGRLQIATVRSVAPHVAVTVPEACVFGLSETSSGELARGGHPDLKKQIVAADAVLIGPGMLSGSRYPAELLRRVRRLNPECPVVADAGALRAFTELAGKKICQGIITPHAGEMAELWGCPKDEVLARPLEIAREAAFELGVVVALKGAQTVVVAPDGTAYRNTAGNVGLGTSGSGDTLSGVIAGLCARGATALQAAAWGVFLHAKAGDILAGRIGALGFLARELLSEIPPLLVRTAR